MKKAITIILIISASLLFASSSMMISKGSVKPEPTPEKTIYDICVERTIVSPFLLRAIARVESDEMDSAIGDGGMSLGRFQLNEKYHAMRARAYGEYDPRDPVQAGRIAALYLEECIRAFPGDIVKAVCAYRQGIYGVKRNGPTTWYFERVRGKV